jgi:hypothetical protein
VVNLDGARTIDSVGETEAIDVRERAISQHDRQGLIRIEGGIRPRDSICRNAVLMTDAVMRYVAMGSEDVA